VEAVSDNDQPGAAETEEAARPELDFWSFIAMANERLGGEYNFRHQLATEVLLTLNRASNVFTYDLESSIHRPRGWSWASFRLLFVTWLAGPIEPKKAAELAGMSRAAVSNLTKSLVSEGLITRSPDDQDGRSVRLALTARGQCQMREAFHEQNEREYAWASALTEAEQRILVMLLDKLITNRDQFDVRGRT
jgi:MarR family transcriptional regulator, negative regulator of the multidrug operon emrRAB